MALTNQELKDWFIDYVNTNPGWGWSQWNDETYMFGLHHKFDQQLIDAKAMYVEKLKRMYAFWKDIRQILQYGVGQVFIDATADEDILDLDRLKTRVKRMARKVRAINAEIEERSRGFFGPGLTYNRVYHGTDYYIDLSGGTGNDLADGLGVNTHPAANSAWLTISKYTEGTVRSAGDNAFIRANTSEVVGAVVGFDENGTYAGGYISIIGCDSVVNDPWGDADDTLPLLDFNSSAANYYNMSGDNYWLLERLHFFDCDRVNGGVFEKNVSEKTIIRGIQSSGHGSDCYGFRFQNYGGTIVEDSDFDGAGYGIHATVGTTVVRSSSFDGCNDAGLYGQSGARVFGYDLLFSQASVNGRDVDAKSDAVIFIQHSNVAGTDDYRGGTGANVFVEDEDVTFGAHHSESEILIIDKDTGTTRPGGGNSVKMAPTSQCDGYNMGSASQGMFCVAEDFQPDWTWKRWMETGSQTLTLYARADSVFATYPINTELFVRASYVSGAGTGERTIVSSTAVLDDGTDWVAFSVTVNPAVASFVYFDIFLGWYQSGKYILVDEIPVVS